MSKIAITLLILMWHSIASADLWMYKKCIGYDGAKRDQLACVFQSAEAVEQIFEQAKKLGINPSQPWEKVEKGYSHWSRLIAIYYPAHVKTELYIKQNALICNQSTDYDQLPWRCKLQEKIKLVSNSPEVPAVWLHGIDVGSQKELVREMPSLLISAVKTKSKGHFNNPPYSINYEKETGEMFLRYAVFGENCGSTNTIRVIKLKSGRYRLRMDWDNDRSDICI